MISHSFAEVGFKAKKRAKMSLLKDFIDFIGAEKIVKSKFYKNEKE